MVLKRLSTFVGVLWLSLKNGLKKLTNPAALVRYGRRAPGEVKKAVLLPFLAARALYRKLRP